VRQWQARLVASNPTPPSIIDPRQSTLYTVIVYAADLSTGVYRSDDGGKLWVQIAKGLTMRAVKSLAVSFRRRTLYAATEGGGVFPPGCQARCRERR